LLHSTFFKGKVKSGNFGGFYCFSLRGLLKKGVISFGWVQLREGNYGRLIDFLSQISKLSNFNLPDFADFMMITSFPFPFLCQYSRTPVLAICPSFRASSFIGSSG